MIRILVVGDFIKGSGLTNYLINTYHYFPSDSFKIDCLSFAGTSSLEDWANEQGWGFYHIVPVTHNPIKHWIMWWKFLKENANRYDVIHFNYSAAWNFLAIMIAKKYGAKKVIVHSHSEYYSKTPKNIVIKKLLDFFNLIGKKVISANSDINLAVSSEAGKWMFKNEDFYIQKNGLKLADFSFKQSSRERLRKKLNLSNKTKVFGFVGALREQKNTLFAIKLMKDVSNQDSNIKLLIFGDGPDKDYLIGQCNQLGLNKNVIFMGVQKNVNDWYSAMDAFVFPSKSEGFGFVLLEAQANGLPAFCSDSIPRDVMITNSVYSISLKEKAMWLQNLISVPVASVGERNKESVKNCYTIQENGYSIESTSKELRELIEHCVNGDKYFE